MSLTDREMLGLLDQAAELIKEYSIRTGTNVFEILQKIEVLLESK